MRASIFTTLAFCILSSSIHGQVLQDNYTPSGPDTASGYSFEQLGAKVTATYNGEAIGITAIADGARLRSGFQELTADVTRAGLMVSSTEEGRCGSVQLVAVAVARGANSKPLRATGEVVRDKDLVRFVRPGVVEEYSVSADGVRQDFLVQERPDGEGELLLSIALCGAEADATTEGISLKLDASGRELAYRRLLVTDAEDRELVASLEVQADDRLAVRVNDDGATYPLRIDPTFSDADWISMTAPWPATNGGVIASVIDGNGDLYVSGNFNMIDGVSAIGGVAKWDGSSWSALGSGLSGGARALAVIGNDLYAGGSISTAGGVSVNNIAKWDGSSWSALGSGTDGPVIALAVSGNVLYAGGDFTWAGITVNHIAKWDGSSWSALGSGTNYKIESLAVSGNNLYAGGAFTTAGGGSANHIAKWDGSSWSALGSGMSQDVYVLAVSGNDLYAGGSFTTAGGASANFIAKWNGSSWSPLGSGMNSIVYALEVNGNDLYAGGGFSVAGGVPAWFIAKWDGSSWSPLGSGLDGTVYALAVGGDYLYVGGLFDGNATETTISPYIIKGYIGVDAGILDANAGGPDNALQLWPNPVEHGVVNIRLSGISATRERIRVDVYDAFGKRVIADQFANSDDLGNAVLKLDEGTASGLYYVNVTVNDRVYTQRLSVL